MKPFLVVILLFSWILTGCSEEGASVSAEDYQWKLPEDFPQPRVPENNAMSEEKVTLGRLLFYDRRLSVTLTRSCGDCHEQRRGFTDNLQTSIGVTVDQVHARNALTLTNVAYNSVFNWANPNFRTLEQQASGVLFNETPVELGWADREQQMLDRLRLDSQYPELFKAAFPEETDPVSVGNVEKALASFERVLISGESDFDRFNRGDLNALTTSARAGLELFFSERLECFHCHGGFNFSQTVEHEGVQFTQVEFHNNGLYNIDGSGAYPANNTGLWEFTGKDQDMGKFRAPTLRNIALTAPYMHDGSIATLQSVIVDHYSRGGRLIAAGPYAGDGALNPYQSSLLQGFQLSNEEAQQLLDFFDSLTDWSFICNQTFSDPFGNIPMHENCS